MPAHLIFPFAEVGQGNRLNGLNKAKRLNGLNSLLSDYGKFVIPIR